MCFSTWSAKVCHGLAEKGKEKGKMDGACCTNESCQKGDTNWTALAVSNCKPDELALTGICPGASPVEPVRLFSCISSHLLSSLRLYYLTSPDLVRWSPSPGFPLFRPLDSFLCHCCVRAQLHSFSNFNSNPNVAALGTPSLIHRPERDGEARATNIPPICCIGVRGVHSHIPVKVAGGREDTMLLLVSRLVGD